MTLLKQILADADAAPDLFHFYGPIETTQLRFFLRQRQWVVPADLFEVWTTVGGMDFFADEIILAPIVHYAWQDHLEEHSGWVKEAGNEKKFVLFHRGLGNTMIEQKTLRIKMFDRADYGNGPSKDYDTCLDWYINEIRNEYAHFWLLPPVLSHATNHTLRPKNNPT